jgi:hypothetical protein
MLGNVLARSPAVRLQREQDNGVAGRKRRRCATALTLNLVTQEVGWVPMERSAGNQPASLVLVEASSRACLASRTMVARGSIWSLAGSSRQ